MNIHDVIVTSVTGIFTVPAEKGRLLEISRRPCYGLSFCLDGGRIVYTHNGKKTVSDREGAVILPMNESYTLYNEEGGNFPIINFLTAKPFTNEFLSVRLKHPDIYLKEYETMRKLWHIPGNGARVMSMLYGMLDRLSRAGEVTHPALSAAMEYMLKHLSSPELSNVELARVADVSEVYLRRLFNEHYGTTPKQYVLNLRIDEAKRLMDEGISSVGTIAESCGFSGIYHFSRMFKTVTGVSPSEYIKRGK